MTIPNLPTDSLYKFGFVGGLALIVVSSLMSDKLINERLSPNALDHIELISPDEIKMIEKIGRTMKFADSIMQDTVLRRERKLEIVRKSGFHVDTATLALILSKVKYRSSQNELRSRSFELEFEMTRYYKWFGYFLTVLFGLIWYFQLQKPQDEILKMQKELLELELKKKKDEQP